MKLCCLVGIAKQDSRVVFSSLFLPDHIEVIDIYAKLGSKYTYVCFNTSLRQLDAKIDVSYKTVYRRVQRFLRALDAPLPHPEGPVEIDDLYVKAGLNDRERDQPLRSRGLSTRGRGTYFC